MRALGITLIPATGTVKSLSYDGAFSHVVCAPSVFLNKIQYKKDQMKFNYNIM